MVGEYVQKKDAHLAFNPGSIQLHEGVESFAFLLPLTTVLFINKEEAEIIAGEKGTVAHLLKRIHAKGVKVVSITCGEMGSYAIDEHGTIYQKDAVACPVVEKTGAGDAYASGFLASYLHTGNVERSMSWGLHNSASVIGQAGAQSGLLTKKELEERVIK
jgi:sugar/nucleoside kinase (ribokinase family)